MIRYVAFQPSAVPPPVVAFLAPSASSAGAEAEAREAKDGRPGDEERRGKGPQRSRTRFGVRPEHGEKGEHEPLLPLANSTCQAGAFSLAMSSCADSFRACGFCQEQRLRPAEVETEAFFFRLVPCGRILIATDAFMAVHGGSAAVTLTASHGGLGT